MSSLYQIQQEYLQLAQQLEESEYLSVEEQEKLEALVKINAEQFATKAQAYLHIMNSLSMEAELAEREIERIQRFVAEKKKAEEKLKAALLQALLLYGEEEKTKDGNSIFRKQIGNVRLSTRRSTQIDINDPEVLPDECFNYSIEIKIPNREDAEVAIVMINDIVANIPSATYKSDRSISKTKIKEEIEKAEAEERNFQGATQETYYSLVIK